MAQVANDPHYRIVGGELDQLDDVSTGGATGGCLLQCTIVMGQPVWVAQPASTVISNFVALGDLLDVTDGFGTTGKTNTVPYAFIGNGAGELTVVDVTADANYAEAIEDIIGAAFQNGTDTTFVYNDGAGTMQVNVDDVFLRNTGDSLDSGTLTISSGANLSIAGGATFQIAGTSTATIVTPAGGFSGSTSLVNKEYVDSVAAGLDPKESVRVATTPTDGDITGAPFGGTYVPAGGPTGTGQFTGVDMSAATGGTIDGFNFTGVSTTGLILNDRVLIKNQTAQTQNGIYEITAAPTAANVTLTRAVDQDGSPANEVSGGNFTFVEDTTAIFGASVNSNTGWAVAWDGTITLNTDPVIWVQFNGAGAINAGIALSQSGNTIDVDANNATAASIQTTPGDELIFHDQDGAPSASLSQTRKITIENFLTDLEIPNNIGGNGIVVRTAPGSFTNRTIIGSTTHAGGAGFTGLEGISIGRGDGVSGNPEVGLDIVGLTAVGRNMAAGDLFVLYDGTNNESITGQQIADGVTGIAGFQGYGQIANDGTTISAQSANELVTFTGTGIGITGTNSATPGLDTLNFALDISDLTLGTGPIVFTDEIAVNDGGTTLRFTFNDVVDDLDIVHGITANGLVVRTGADTYASRSIAVDGLGNKDGLSVSNGDGAAGDPTVGLDITNGLPAAGEDMVATDELAVYNASATANEKMTGQDIADGVVNIIFGLNTNLTITNIDGQPTLVFDDTTRGGKTLSVAETAFQWSEAVLSNNDWLNIGTAVDSDSGFLMPHNATLVKVTAHCENNNGATKDIDLYLNDNAAKTLTLGTFTGAAGQKTFSSVTVNQDVTAGDRIKLRAGPSGGNIQDTVVTVWVKWRA